MLRHGYAEVNGIRLHYASVGAGKLILFAHGFPEFWYAWKNQLLEFGRDHLAVAPDLRGYNLSSKPAGVEQYEVPHLVEDIRGLARHLGHEKFLLVGHDWGGVVAWVYALFRPDDLEKLVVINAPHPAVFARELRENPAQQKASRYMVFFQSRMAEPVLSAFRYAALARRVLGEGLKRGYFTQEDRDAYIQAWSQPGALTGGLNYYRAARIRLRGSKEGSEAFKRPASLTSFQVRTPTLVIWGEQDSHLLNGNLNGLDQFVPDLTLRRIPDGSHWVVHEKPALVNRYIREFIARNA